jgi:hypothetical protein
MTMAQQMLGDPASLQAMQQMQQAMGGMGGAGAGRMGQAMGGFGSGYAPPPSAGFPAPAPVAPSPPNTAALRPPQAQAPSEAKSEDELIAEAIARSLQDK